MCRCETAPSEENENCWGYNFGQQRLAILPISAEMKLLETATNGACQSTYTVTYGTVPYVPCPGLHGHATESMRLQMQCTLGAMAIQSKLVQAPFSACTIFSLDSLLADTE